MTEDEAKAKWCCGPPMNVMAAGIASGRRELTATDGQCVASGCMAWRWTFRAPQRPRDAYPGWDTPVATEDGYCGLAGAQT